MTLFLCIATSKISCDTNSFQVAVFYGGVEIPDSPFAMTSNPNLDDVIDATQDIGSSRKPSRLAGQGDGGDDEDDDAELIYSRNGTGMQRKPTKGKKSLNDSLFLLAYASAAL